MTKSRLVRFVALAIFLLATLGCASPPLPKDEKWYHEVGLQKMALQEKWDREREAKEKGEKRAREDFEKGIRPALK